MVIMKSIFPMHFESPCDLDARKSFPNAPDYELKLNSGPILHLVAAVSGKGKIDVGITYTDDVHQQVHCCTSPRFVPLRSQEKRHVAQKDPVSPVFTDTSLPTR